MESAIMDSQKDNATNALNSNPRRYILDSIIAFDIAWTG